MVTDGGDACAVWVNVCAYACADCCLCFGTLATCYGAAALSPQVRMTYCESCKYYQPKLSRMPFIYRPCEPKDFQIVFFIQYLHALRLFDCRLRLLSLATASALLFMVCHHMSENNDLKR